MKTWTLGAGIRLPLAVGFFAAALLLAAASPAWAANMTVTTTDDVLTPPTSNGLCSLREAILNSNANAVVNADCPAVGSLGASGVDTIGFAPGVAGEITLTVGATSADRQLFIPFTSEGVTINGPGADVLSVSGSDSSRVFRFEGGTNEINGLTITEGNAPSDFAGGNGISNASDSLTLDEVAIVDNDNAGVFGGGVASVTNLTVKNSVISGNTAFAGGGVSADNAAIINSTISGNEATFAGGGVGNSNGLVEIRNSTITGNTAPANMGSGVRSLGGVNTQTKVFSSIIAGNTNSDVDFAIEPNPIVSEGFNLIGTTGTNALTAFNKGTDQTGVADPLLEPLADNGGPTTTHEVEATSPALDKGKSGEASLATDQRGESRTSEFPAVPNAPGGDGTDIGAFERQAPNPLGCTVFGTPGNDVLRGTPGRDVICGFGGDDFINGLGGNDLIYAGAGNDVILGGEGDDLIFGQQGSNLIFGQGGADRLRGGAGNDRLRGGEGADDLRGGPGSDDLRGQGGNDLVLGGAGSDVILGGAGNDFLAGQTGLDKLFGEAGNDILNVRDGRPGDLANGGGGNDRCASDPGDRRVSCER